MDIRAIGRNVLPAIAVMVVGVLGAYLVYQNYFSDRVTAEQASAYAPAAGEEVAADEEAMAADETMAVEDPMAAGEVEATTIGDTTVQTTDALGRKVDENGCVVDDLGAVVKDESTEDPEDCVKGVGLEPGPDSLEEAVEGEATHTDGTAADEAGTNVPATEEAPAAE